MQIKCPICGKTYPDAERASKCESSHVRAADVYEPKKGDYGRGEAYADAIRVKMEDGAVIKYFLESVTEEKAPKPDLAFAYKEKADKTDVYMVKNVCEEHVKERTGETLRMNCGARATIVRYGGVNDIDVLFENGALVEHTEYAKFKQRSVLPASNFSKYGANVRERYRAQRVGETMLMRNGHVAVITAYESSKNITVEFDSGEVREGIAYENFKNGCVALEQKTRLSHIGEKRMMKCGKEAEIIDYHKSTDITVKFESGEIRKHVTYAHFYNGHLLPAKKTDAEAAKKLRIGEERVMNCKLKARIISYERHHDLDVEFENGYVREHISYQSFKKGTVIPSSKTREQYDKEKKGEE